MWELKERALDYGEKVKGKEGQVITAVRLSWLQQITP